jgi:sporulation protein YlmC with PRC-barrel domain
MFGAAGLFRAHLCAIPWRLKMLKHTLATTAFAALMLSSALAQSNPPSAASGATKPMPAPSTVAPPSPGSGMFLLQQSSSEWRASKLIGTNVVGPDNVKIGAIEDVVVENNGTVRAIVIGVGGFLGVGEKGVAISLKSLVIKQSPNGDKVEKVSVSFTKEQLKNAPGFKWNQAAAASPSDKHGKKVSSK